MATDYQAMADQRRNDLSNDGQSVSKRDATSSTNRQSPSKDDQTVSIAHQTVSKVGYPPSMRRQTVSKARQSAIFSGQSIDAKRPIFERGIGIALLILSFACTIATFNGAWSLQPSIKAIAIGVGSQGLATAGQWFWRNQRLSIWYVIAILFDAGMSVKGFSIPLLSPFKNIASSIIPDSSAAYAAWSLIIVLSLALAVLPEVILIDKD